MEVIVFWLVPVALLVVLILLTLQVIKHGRKHTLYIIEPTNFLVSGWHVARFEPDNQTLKQTFKLLATSNLSKGSLLEKIIVSANSSVSLKSKSSTGTLVEHQSFGALSEQFVLEIGSKKQSFLIGPLDQIEEFLEDEKITKYRTLSQKSAENGYLALVIATSFVHGDRPKKSKYKIEGLVVLEPVIDQDIVAVLNQTKHKPIRFLTVLPVGVASHLYAQVFPDKPHFNLNAKELETLLPPKFAEADLEKAIVVGGADIVARHQALRVWQRQYDCIVVSRNPEDRDLPITPVTHFG
ncbi:MAG: hypothetical protein NUV80_00745 [Candidatus Berkelbacteria bacterium]|nr:hypothetical protein [Candidatus Berkelbacteria bacterium]MCR4307067.1 hypothetical protein [Candidatus Berkelbacteria bacterium]